MCGSGRTIADPRLSPSGELVAFVVMGQGPARIVTVPTSGGPEVVVAFDPAVAGVHPHGGGVFGWVMGGSRIIYAGADGSICEVPASGGPGSTLIDGFELAGSTGRTRQGAGKEAGGRDEVRISCLSPSPDGSKLAVVLDDREVWVCALEAGGLASTLERVSGGTGAGGGDPDFCLDAIWHPGSDRLAWVEWDVPDMPWDSSRVVVGRLDRGEAPVVVAGGKGVSVGQPRFSPDGSALAFTSDEAGWAELWVATSDGGSPTRAVLRAGSADRDAAHSEHMGREESKAGRSQPTAAGEEHAEPTWGPGQRSYCWSPASDAIAVATNRGGFWEMGIVELADRRVAKAVEGHCAGLDWAAGRLAFVHSSPLSPTSLKAITLPHEGWRIDGFGEEPLVLARGPVGGFEEQGCPEPEPFEWVSKDTHRSPPDGSPARRSHARSERESQAAPSGVQVSLHGRLYRPTVRRADPPPMIVWLHGGPMGQMSAEFNARLSFFSQRGWAVFTPDYRGSSGWGREYAQALHLRWGEVDVDDCASGVSAVLRAGLAAPGQVVVLGASAGGFTALWLLARFPELFCAGIDLYGVTDLSDLVETTHRYEAHYMESMIGSAMTDQALYVARSPISGARSIRSPLLVLHGGEDPVVPLSQSERLVSVVEESGTPVELVVLGGERHGWSNPASIEVELRAIERFLARHTLGRPELR